MRVLITGGTGDIGREAVRAFCERGDRVAFTYLCREERAQQIAAQTGALALRADAADPEQITRAVEQARAYLGGFDLLINNAATSSFALLTDLTVAQWRAFLAVNLDSHVFYTQQILHDMIRQKSGCILNVASVWGQTGASCEVHYSTAKAGLIGFTKALAKEVGPSGIRVNCVAPGVIDTGMNRSLSEEDLRALCDETPLGRLGTPAEVVSAFLFLSAPAGAFYTGQVLAPNGGFYI